MDENSFDLDGWSRWDMPTSDYYDTRTFPDGYTGYDGSEVWEFIHERICFTDYKSNDDHWKADFNKAVSGVHSMVSAQVVRGIKEKVDSGVPFLESEVWRDPKKEFQRRLSRSGKTPEALENLYFGFMLLLTAVSTVKQRLIDDCESGALESGAASDLKAVFSCSLLKHESVGAASRKLRDHAVKDAASVESLWEARLHSRDLVRIMNCVQCNTCRLHGKIAALGLATAMHILIGRAGKGVDPSELHRVELAALVKSLQRFSAAIEFCREMN